MTVQPKAAPEAWLGLEARQVALAWATAALPQPDQAAADHWLGQLRCERMLSRCTRSGTKTRQGVATNAFAHICPV